jgi:class 3 adenylate cyclase/YHS domain-containing protein
MTEREATFVFADIAGFTALTEAHGDEEAFAVVRDFCDAIRAELPSFGGTYVKTIGDAVMLRMHEPAGAIELGLKAVKGLLGGHAAPEVAVGLHQGPAVEHEGDYYGAAVNIAARVAALAASGEVLVTGTTAAVVPDLDGVIFEPRGRRALRNVRDPVELFAAKSVGPGSRDDLPIDPVCRMAVDDQRAAGRLVHEGEAYYFCSLTCAGAFANQPERFAGTRDTGSPS